MYALDNEKNTIAPVFLEFTSHKNNILIKFINTLPIPIPIIRRFVKTVDIPAIP